MVQMPESARFLAWRDPTGDWRSICPEIGVASCGVSERNALDTLYDVVRGYLRGMDEAGLERQLAECRGRHDGYWLDYLEEYPEADMADVQELLALADKVLSLRKRVGIDVDGIINPDRPSSKFAHSIYALRRDLDAGEKAYQEELKALHAAAAPLVEEAIRHVDDRVAALGVSRAELEVLSAAVAAGQQAAS